MANLKPYVCQNIVTDGSDIYSKNLAPGHSIYGERLVRYEGREYRRWEPKRSKMAAYILLTQRCGAIEKNDVVIYLGAATGTTVSHISDIVSEGTVYAVEISKRAFRELLKNCGDRSNIVPVLGDARNPELLSGLLSRADYLYVDIAQRDQVQIFTSSMRRYRCRNGMFMLKCRSIDVAKVPIQVARSAVESISDAGLKVLERVDIGAYEKDHFAILAKRLPD